MINIPKILSMGMFKVFGIYGRKYMEYSKELDFQVYYGIIFKKVKLKNKKISNLVNRYLVGD